MIKIPINCPCCGSTLERVTDQLFCRNQGCGATAQKRVLNYCAKRKIKGLAEKSIEKLNLTSVAAIYGLTEKELEDTLGKNGIKVFAEIQKSLTTTIPDLVGSLSIPLVGRTTAKKIKGSSLDDLDYGGLPPKAKENFTKWTRSTEYAQLLNLPFNIAEVIVNSVGIEKGNICITGSFKGYNRSSLKELAESKGWNVTTTVTKNTNTLLADKPSETSKYKKAVELGINIIYTTEEL